MNLHRILPGSMATLPANWQWLVRLFRYAHRYWKQLAAGVGLGLVASAAQCAQVVVLKYSVEAATSPVPARIVIGWMCLLATCVAVTAVADAFHNWRMSVTTQRLVLDLQNDVHRKLHTLSEQYLASSSPGECAHLVLNDTAVAQQGVGLVISTLVRHPATLVVLAGYLIYMDWITAVLALIGYVFVLLLVRLLMRGLQDTARQLQEARGSIHQRFLNLLAGRDLLRCLDTLGKVVESFSQANDLFHALGSRYVARKCTVSPLSRVIGTVFVIALVGFTAWRLHRGEISPGTAAAIAASLIAFYQPISRLAGFSTALLESLASTRRVFTLLDTPAYWLPDRPPVAILDRLQHIDFINVEQRFVGRDFAVHAGKLRLEAGQVTLIIGPSGSGKTTLIKLLIAALQPTGGTILLNGQAASLLSQRWFQQQLAYTPQGCPVLGQTIREEITLGRENLLLSELEEAARNAEVFDWIHGLPRQWDTPIGPAGMCISGGQQQRLVLARLFLQTRSLYVLDEPTAHLDRAIESRVVERLCRHIRNQHAIGVIVSHRPGLIEHADQVMQVHEGSVVPLRAPGFRDLTLDPSGFLMASQPARDLA